MISFFTVKETSVSAFSPQSDNQLSEQSLQPEGGQVASFSNEATDTKINPADIDFSDMASSSVIKKPHETQTTGSTPKTPSNDHGLSGSEVNEPQKDVSAPKPLPKPQPVKLVTPPQPVAPSRTPKPPPPAVPAAPVVPALPAVPAALAVPAQPAAPAQPAVPAQPIKPFLPAAPVQPVAMPVQTIESAIGQQNGFLTQSAPQAASFNPGALSTKLASMSRYFDSPSSVPNSFATQPYHQPLASVQVPQQTSAPHVQPKKPQAEAPEPVKPEVTPYAALNVSQVCVTV